MKIVDVSNISIYIDGVYVGYARKGILFDNQQMTIDKIKLYNHKPPPDLIFKIKAKTTLTYTYEKEKHAINLFLKDVVFTLLSNGLILQVSANFENDLGE